VKKTFSYEYEQGPDPRRFSFEYSLDEDETLDVSTSNGMLFLSLNSAGLLTLAKIFIRLADETYSTDGYHIHLNQDFNADLPEKIVIVRTPDVITNAAGVR